MGLRGPAPKPSGLRVLEGNPARRPLPTNEPRPLPGEPDMPDYLDVDARKEWKHFVKILLEMRVLTKADGTALGNLCQAISILACSRNVAASKKGRRVGAFDENPQRLCSAVATHRNHQRTGGDHQPDLTRIRPNAVFSHPPRGHRA